MFLGRQKAEPTQQSTLQGHQVHTTRQYINRVLPVTPPHKSKLGVRLVLPPVTEEDPVYAPSSDRGLLDDEGYIIPSSSYPGSI